MRSARQEAAGSAVTGRGVRRVGGTLACSALPRKPAQHAFPSPREIQKPACPRPPPLQACTGAAAVPAGPKCAAQPPGHATHVTCAMLLMARIRCSSASSCSGWTCGAGGQGGGVLASNAVPSAGQRAMHSWWHAGPLARGEAGPCGAHAGGSSRAALGFPYHSPPS